MTDSKIKFTIPRVKITELPINPLINDPSIPNLRSKLNRFQRELTHNFETSYQIYWQDVQIKTLDLLAHQLVKEAITLDASHDPELLFWQIRSRLEENLKTKTQINLTD